ncbi:MAG: hypothetical protein MUF53_11195 [Gemmatimonadaceae bacterium]|nr:hypothetical protein [Gemmatimonadaceae bacterium]
MTRVQYAKGATLRGTLAWLDGAMGSLAARRLVQKALGRPEASGLAAVGATAEVEYATLVRLWTAIDAALGASRSGWAADAGAHSITSVGQQLYGGILAKRSPAEFLLQSVSLFQLFYRPGDMTVVESRDGYAVLRLEGFDPITGLFCERLRGGLVAALGAAGGAQGRVRHVRCALEGDAFCEWELRWVSGHGATTG